jgi:hypothetical protein
MLPVPSGDPIDPNEPILGLPEYSAFPELPQQYYAPNHVAHYAPPPNPYLAYGPVPAADRPGEALFAAILALIASGLLLVTGFVLIFAASTFDSDPDIVSDRTTEFVLAGLGNVIAASLLIIGAVLMLGRSRGARMGIVLGALSSFALAVFWLNQPDNEDDIFWLFIFCAPTFLAGLLTLSTRVTAWLNAERSRAS